MQLIQRILIFAFLIAHCFLSSVEGQQATAAKVQKPVVATKISPPFSFKRATGTETKRGDVWRPEERGSFDRDAVVDHYSDGPQRSDSCDKSWKALRGGHHDCQQNFRFSSDRSDCFGHDGRRPGTFD